MQSDCRISHESALAINRAVESTALVYKVQEVNSLGYTQSVQFLE